MFVLTERGKEAVRAHLELEAKWVTGEMDVVTHLYWLRLLENRYGHSLYQIYEAAALLRSRPYSKLGKCRPKDLKRAGLIKNG